MPQKTATVQLVHAVVSRNYYGSHGGGVIMDVHSRQQSQPQSITAAGSELQLTCQVKDCAQRYIFQLFTHEKMQQLQRAARSSRTKRLGLGLVLSVAGGALVALGHDAALAQGVGIGLCISGVAVAVASVLLLFFGRPQMYSLQPVGDEADDQGFGVRYVVHDVELN